jgi:signal transduction histidine kinase/PAS domain-containing protein
LHLYAREGRAPCEPVRKALREEANVRVLFIGSDDVPVPSWSDGEGRSVELVRATSLPAAARRLTSGAVDLVLAEPGLVAELADTRAELARSEARFRDVIERNADAIVVVDPDGAVRFANGAAAQLFGRSAAELVGSHFGYPMTVGESTEIDLVRAGAPARVAELRVVESEWEGHPAWIVSLRDITERKRAEESARSLIREQTARTAAEHSARRFRFLAEATTMLSSSLDYESTLSAVARLCVAEMADWALVYIVGDDGPVRRLEVAHRDPVKLHLVEELRALPIEAEGNHPVLEVLETGRSLLIRDVAAEDFARIAQDDRHLEILRELGASSFMLVPLIARGRSLGALGLVCASDARRFDDQDLALAENLASRAALAVDNARLYREAQEATRSKTDLLAVISHDLRTPLNSIIGYAELLILGVPETLSEGARERVERMRAGARHLLHLINQLLAMSRLDAGREEIHAEDVDVADLVQEVAVVVEPLALERHLEFRVEVPPSPVRIRTDGGKLRQVLVNLAANAVKFTETGEVRVQLAPVDDEVVLSVADTGSGIAEEHLDRIFEPFWQVDANGREGERGSGLGLAVVRRMVELLGGRITVRSRVGDGSEFTVTLPSNRDGASAA